MITNTLSPRLRCKPPNGVPTSAALPGGRVILGGTRSRAGGTHSLSWTLGLPVPSVSSIIMAPYSCPESGRDPPLSLICGFVECQAGGDAGLPMQAGEDILTSTTPPPAPLLLEPPPRSTRSPPEMVVPLPLLSPPPSGSAGGYNLGVSTCVWPTFACASTCTKSVKVMTRGKGPSDRFHISPAHFVAR